MRDLTQKLLAIFEIEYKEHLTRIRAILTAVSPDGGTLAGTALDEALRRAHSLKGAARAVGLLTVERLSHELESVFAKIRDGKVAFDRSMIPAFHLVLDSLEDTVAASAGKRTPPEPVQALDTLTALAEGRPAPAAPTAAAAALPPEPMASTAEAPRLAETTLRVQTQHIDSILEIADDLMAEGVRHNMVAREFSELARDLSRRNREQSAVRQKAGSQLRRLASMAEFSSVIAYVNYLEDQVLSFTSRGRDLAGAQRRGAWSLHQLTGNLRETVLRARMIPADSLYEGFGKMVRDLARSAGKDIVYEARGLHTSADRRVLESLRDPIMHMLRNAVDHAIEPPDARRRHGKTPAGSIVLSLAAAAGKLVVTVEDDGRGLDAGKIAQVAERDGLAAKPDESVERLIFQPGFSTAEAVTDLSGRGMGLSVVQDAVMRLQGQINVQSNPAGGTTFVIATPLAISSQHVILLSCAGQVFALPAHMTERLHRAAGPHDFEIVEGKPIFHAEGRAVPVVNLARLLHLEPSGTPAEKPALAIVNVNGRRTALLVDAFLSERRAVVQDLGDAAVFGEKVSGAFLLEDGSVAPILNMAGVLGESAHSPADWSSWTPAEPPARKEASILVVDDSMTTRTLEKNILESQGYRVGISVDGSQALARLQLETFDLVITDVEMPVLNGFGLIQEMKKDPKLARIPVIIVSSLEKREDQERGLSLGADAYIVKRSFEQQELLETIRQII